MKFIPGIDQLVYQSVEDSNREQLKQQIVDALNKARNEAMEKVDEL